MERERVKLAVKDVLKRVDPQQLNGFVIELERQILIKRICEKISNDTEQAVLEAIDEFQTKKS